MAYEPSEDDEVVYPGEDAEPEDCGVEPPGEGKFRCAMCGAIFEMGDDEAAREEAALQGLDPQSCDMVCDKCYRLTPFGADPDGVNPN
jgi:hypothetical protein